MLRRSRAHHFASLFAAATALLFAVAALPPTAPADDLGAALAAPEEDPATVPAAPLRRIPLQR
jgi:hypothetical protein